MWVDVARLYHFYASPQGALVTHVTSKLIQNMWPDTRHETVVGFGYTLPFLASYKDSAQRLFFLMPAPIGVRPWPDSGKNLTCLCPIDRIPLPDCSVNKLLLTHALEFAPSPLALLKEAWRVLVPGGELIICTPNRRGLWARSPHNPFGDGTPYAGRQLFALAENACFFPDKPTYCLFYPPVTPTLSKSACDALEHFGRTWLKKVGGLVMLRAHKKVIANIKEQAPSMGRRIFLPDGLAPQRRALGQSAA